MSAESHKPLSNQAIYFAALEISDQQQRRLFLDEACGENVQRRRIIERLLAIGVPGSDSPLDRAINQLESEGTMAEEGSDAGDNADSLEFDFAVHPTIDRYKLLQQIGEGGMGTVFMAEQTQPIKRMVALKLVKPGMNRRDVIARFEAERQALALMDHPNIAQVLDAGTTVEGQPYFVMELVRGISITAYCDQSRLAIDERLRLFIDVCRAVQHAHQKGIIHRDLKPSNVMLTLHDGTPVVKVIDFGVAKALNQELTERTLFTQFAQMIGTPLYMSPEQAEMSGLDIDTRSDVYSLGVLLYELLTGTTPFDKETLIKAGFDEMRRIIRETEPSRPSQKVNALAADQLSTVADRRAADPRQLSLSMRRELDWIVMKALEKDRNRRYESAFSLAADLERYLADEPVEACPPSAFYRLRKLTRRNRGLLSAAATIVGLMLIGLVVSSQFAIRASHAKHAARAAQREAEQTTEEMRSLLYASDVMLAAQDWRHNDVHQARNRLARHIPQAGKRDLRGFEWHYLWKQQAVAGVEIANLGSAVYDIAFSPDGKQFAATGAGGVIHLFDTNSGKTQSTIATQQGETNGIAFSPDSSRIAASGDDGTLRVWDLVSGRQLWVAKVHDGLAYQVKYSPGGETLVTCGKDDARVRLWDASNGAPLGTLNEHQHGIETIAISASGGVAAGDRRSYMTYWDLQKGEPVWTAGVADPDPICAVDFSAGFYLAQANLSGQLTIMDTRSGTMVSQRRFADGIQSLAFAPRESWLAIGDGAGHLRIVPFEHGAWDLRAAREWPAHDGKIYAVKVTPDGKRILSGGADGRVMAWEPQAGTPDKVLQFEQHYTTLRPLGNQQFVLAGQDHVTIRDHAGSVIKRFGVPDHFHIASALPARLVFAASLVGAVRAWNFDTGEQVFLWPSDDQLENVALAVTADGRTLCLTSRDLGGDFRLQVIDVRSGSLLDELPVRNANHLDVSPDGRWLVFNSNNDLQLYDISQRTIVGTWQGHQGPIRSLQFSQDGRRVGSVSADRTLKLWSVPAGQVEYSAITHRTGTIGLAFAPDGRRIATAGRDRMLRIWDGQKSEPIWEYLVTAGQILDLRYSLDGQQLLCLCRHQDVYHVLILDGSPSQEQP
jgi:WD40 repeat protein/serine/threonine protein kinase